MDNEHKTTESKGQACRTPWFEYERKMQDAYNTLRHALGSYAFDTEYRQVKGYMEGYLAGMRKMSQELDL